MLYVSLTTESGNVIKKNIDLRKSLDFTQNKLDEATEVQYKTILLNCWSLVRQVMECYLNSMCEILI